MQVNKVPQERDISPCFNNISLFTIYLNFFFAMTEILYLFRSVAGFIDFF